MRMRAAHQRRVQETWQFDVVHETPTAPQQARIFDPRHCGAKILCAHRVSFVSVSRSRAEKCLILCRKREEGKRRQAYFQGQGVVPDKPKEGQSGLGHMATVRGGRATLVAVVASTPCGPSASAIATISRVWTSSHIPARSRYGSIPGNGVDIGSSSLLDDAHEHSHGLSTP